MTTDKVKVLYVEKVFSTSTITLRLRPVPRRGIMGLAPGQGEDGYGKKISTDYVIYIDGRLHRVYCICFSNCGSLYILKKKQAYYLSDGFMSDLKERMKRTKLPPKPCRCPCCDMLPGNCNCGSSRD